MPQKLKILLASHNQHKVEEIRKILNQNKYEIISLSDINFNEEIIEDGITLEENALIKAKAMKSIYEGSIIGEDSGLEIDALDNKPGVNTARFAGPSKDSIGNMEKVLDMMEGIKNRSSRFKTVIALIHKGKEYIVVGIVNGHISHKMRGDKGFGYDPIFIPVGYDMTFAELGDDIKNKLSHRYNATLKLQDLLLKIEKSDH